MSRQLAAQATAQLQVDDLAALSGAIRAVHRRPTTEARQALRRAAESPLRAALVQGGIVYGAAFSPDGTRVVSAGDDGTVKVWEWAGGAAPPVLHHGGKVESAAFSPDGTRVPSGLNAAP